jgi:hypothetical protein
MSTNGTALVQRVEQTAQQVSALGDAQGFDTAQRIGMALSKSTIVPTAYRNNLPNVLVAMEYANRLGASVLAVMQNLDVIEGRPSLRAKFLIGTVNACGRFTPIRFRFQGDEGQDSWGCRAVAKDKDGGEECVGPLITLALAKKEGWFAKKGSKWQTIPELMLMYRSAAWWTNVFAPELSLGIRTTEELEDIGQAIPTYSERRDDALAALQGGDAPALIGDGTPQNERARLEVRRLQCRELDLLDASDEEGIDSALESEDAGLIRTWTTTLAERLDKAGAAIA